MVELKNMKNFNILTELKNFLWLLLPLLWGGIIWMAGWGITAIIRIPLALTYLAMLSILIWLFFPLLEKARKEYKCTFFDHSLLLLPWYFFVAVTFIGLSARLFYFENNYPIINSLIFGIFGSACIEELLARMIFVRYRMSFIRLLIYNVISSLAMTFMHMGFEQTSAPLTDYLFVRGHFIFSFALGLIAYKSRRIELTMIVHMLSNFVRYTLPVLILGNRGTFAQVLSLILDCATLLLIAGTAYEKDSEKNN